MVALIPLLAFALLHHLYLLIWTFASFLTRPHHCLESRQAQITGISSEGPTAFPMVCGSLSLPTRTCLLTPSFWSACGTGVVLEDTPHGSQSRCPFGSVEMCCMVGLWKGWADLVKTDLGGGLPERPRLWLPQKNFTMSFHGFPSNETGDVPSSMVCLGKRGYQWCGTVWLSLQMSIWALPTISSSPIQYKWDVVGGCVTGCCEIPKGRSGLRFWLSATSRKLSCEQLCRIFHACQAFKYQNLKPVLWRWRLQADVVLLLLLIFGSCQCSSKQIS